MNRKRPITNERRTARALYDRNRRQSRTREQIETESQERQTRRNKMTDEQRKVVNKRRRERRQSVNVRRRQIEFHQETEYLAIAPRGISYVIDEIAEHSCGKMDGICGYCGARYFNAEKTSTGYSKCCYKGKVIVKNEPYNEENKKYPQFLIDLFQHTDSKSRNFQTYIRRYNSALSMASMSANIHRFSSNGPFCFRIHGQIYHYAGPLYPAESEIPKFAQIYVYDSDEATNLRMNVPENIPCISELLNELDVYLRENNIYIQSYKMMKDFESEQTALGHDIRDMYMVMSVRTADKRRYNPPVSNEVAMIFMGNSGEPPFDRDIRVYLKSENRLQRLSILDGVVDPLTYPIIYPHGGSGWDMTLKTRNGSNLTHLQYYSFIFQQREGVNQFLLCKKLTHQYIVDSYCKMEANRLHFLRMNQPALRSDSYKGLQDYLLSDSNDKVGKPVILPSTFSGSPRYMQQNYQDAMAIVRTFGKPDLFVTMTCNPNWDEIKEHLYPNQNPSDRPDLIARVFNLKLQEFINLLSSGKLFGPCTAYVYTTEFQKRGLPHAHILVILSNKNCTNPDYIDQVVSAEIPAIDSNPRLYQLVAKHMIHGPCGSYNPSAPCMDNGKCTKNYPFSFNDCTSANVNGYPLYRRSNNGTFIEKTIGGKTIRIYNNYVIPYNSYLLLHFNCHINVEVCATVKSVKYLYKYIHKGHDRAKIQISNNEVFQHDEITQYLDARYVSAPESIWRIFSFKMHDKSHVVYRLALHLENEQNIVFQEGRETDAFQRAQKKHTTLTAWFELNKNDNSARNMFYSDIPMYYTFDNKLNIWKTRKYNKTEKVIGRMYNICVNQGELFYLRLLLLHVKGVTSFTDIRSVDNIVYSTYKEASIKQKLLCDDNEWENAIKEAIQYQMPNQLRQLFAYICIFCNPQNALYLWNKYKEYLIEDYKSIYQNDENASNKALANILEVFHLHGRTFSEFDLPIPNVTIETSSDYDITLEKSYVEDRVSTLHPEQKLIFDIITDAIISDSDHPKCFFIDGPGGTGKTYLYNVLLSYVRGNVFNGEQGIALSGASTGIAATLLAGGRTIHSLFKIPLSTDEIIFSSMTNRSPDWKTIKKAKLILLDECSMCHKKTFLAIDKLLRDIMQIDSPMGGKVFVMGGDFRQTLPVIRHGTRSDAIYSCLKTCELWTQFKICHLKTNMRVRNDNGFSNWLLDVGEGKIRTAPLLGENIIEMDYSRCIKENLITKIFGSEFTPDDIHLYQNQAILCPLNYDTLKMNEDVLNILKGDVKTYNSIDSVNVDSTDHESIQLYPVEYIHQLTPSGMPPHILTLKVGAIVMLLRNLNTKQGLCNGTRLLIKEMKDNVIFVEILTGTSKGTFAFIPRITLIPTDTGLPMQIKRVQFPLRLSFAMTINKAQGQSFDKVGIYLPQPVFSHGQLYVALSRATNKEQLFLKIENTNNQGELEPKKIYTVNCVYKEVL